MATSRSQRLHQLEKRLPRRKRGQVNKGGKKEIGFSGKHRILGIKRHLVVDANGHPLNFTIDRAHYNDQRNLIETIDGIRIGKRRRRPKRLRLDKGYDSEPLLRELRKRRITPNAPYRKNMFQYRGEDHRRIRKKDAIVVSGGKSRGHLLGRTTIADWTDSWKKVKEHIEHLCAYSLSNTT